MLREGIDGDAFRAELRSLDRIARRRRKRELRGWVNAASFAVRPSIYLQFASTSLMIGFLAASYLLHTPKSLLLLFSVIAGYASCWLLRKNSKRARQWREQHPFNEWRRRRGI